MQNLLVIGKTYNPNTYEISSNSILAKVIDIGTISIKIWPNKSKNSCIIPVDALFCFPSINNNTFSLNKNVIIPFFLLEKVYDSPIDMSIPYLINGYKTNFITNNNYDFTISKEIYTIGLIRKCKCPIIFWENNFNDRNCSYADYLMGYKATYNPQTNNYTYNITENVIFIEESKALFTLDITLNNTQILNNNNIISL